MPVVNPTTLIEVGRLRYLIMDAPGQDNITHYIQEMKAAGVTDLVRTCELSYNENEIREAGIRCHELVFPDGEPPSSKILDEWLDVVDDAKSRNACVAVHCVAGLGRAPVLVAVALVERGGFENLDAIEHLRSRRRGAINRRQLQYLRTYQKRSGRPPGCCWFG